MSRFIRSGAAMATFLRADVVEAGGDEVPRTVFARDGKLYIDDRPVPIVFACALDHLAELDEPNRVRVFGPDLLPLVEIAVSTTRAAEQLLQSLKVDELDQPPLQL